MIRTLMRLDPSIQPIRETPDEPPKPVPAPHTLGDLGASVKRTMLANNYPWFPDQNVVSVEGMDPDGTPNRNRPNAFDDIKMVLDGDGRIIGGPWEATTAPGMYFTQHPLKPGGAFIIALGPQACWTPGLYHDVLVWRQAPDSEIKGTRDINKDYERDGPVRTFGDIGVHHHGGYNLPLDDIGHAAAGCQVIRLIAKQQEFMALTLHCPRYLADKANYRLTATVLRARDLLPPDNPLSPDLARHIV
jgi:hypothetical protein